MHTQHTLYASTIKQPGVHTFNELFARVEAAFNAGERDQLVGWPSVFLQPIRQDGESRYAAFKRRCEELRDGHPEDDGNALAVAAEVAEPFLVEAVINSTLSALCFSGDQARRGHWLDNNYSRIQAVEDAFVGGELSDDTYKKLLGLAEYNFENVTPETVRVGRLYGAFCQEVVPHFLPPPIG